MGVSKDLHPCPYGRSYDDTKMWACCTVCYTLTWLWNLRFQFAVRVDTRNEPIEKEQATDHEKPIGNESEI
jgi:hypothetical protein